MCSRDDTSADSHQDASLELGLQRQVTRAMIGALYLAQNCGLREGDLNSLVDILF